MNKLYSLFQKSYFKIEWLFFEFQVKKSLARFLSQKMYFLSIRELTTTVLIHPNKWGRE